ncbi:fimbria/pilus periplasmic chaperone [Escherichia coli]|nr:fimbria/pilus periplasmic chaperone [Escherichia coli]
MKRKIIYSTLFFLLSQLNSIAISAPIIKDNKIYGVRIGSTRVIINNDRGSSLLVKNEKEYPIILQAQVFKDDKETKGPFIITPPLLKLDSGIQTRLRIIPLSHSLHNDRESLYWICIKSLPPESISNKKNQSIAYVNINVMTNSCIKLLERPSSINVSPRDIINDIDFKINQGKLNIENKSPLFVNIQTLMLNNNELKINDRYIKPFANIQINEKIKQGDEVNLTIIDDIGSLISRKVSL